MEQSGESLEYITWYFGFIYFSIFITCMWTKLLHLIWLFATLWTVAHQAPLSMEFSRQEYWSKLLCSPPGDLPHPGKGRVFFLSPALAGRFFTTSATWMMTIETTHTHYNKCFRYWKKKIILHFIHIFNGHKTEFLAKE